MEESFNISGDDLARYKELAKEIFELTGRIEGRANKQKYISINLPSDPRNYLIKALQSPLHNEHPGLGQNPAVDINAQPYPGALREKHFDNSINQKTNTESINSKTKEEFMEYGGYKIYQRTDGRWTAKIPIEGVRVNIYGRTQKQCYENLKKAINKKTYSKPKKTMLYDWLEIWLKTYKMPKLKKSSLYQINVCIKTHIKPHIKNIELEKLTAFDIETALNKITSSRMKKYTFDTYRDALRQAYKNKLIKDNIAEFIDKVTHRREPGRALTVSQRQRFLEKCKQFPHGDLFLFYLYCGARKTEVLQLEWKDVYDETIFLPGTKTENAPRHLPKFQPLAEILSRQTKNSKRIFPISDSTLKREVEKLSRLCGFKFTVKDLRTTFGTMCSEKGIQDKTIAKWMGHSRTETTKAYYVRILDEYETQQKALFNKHFGDEPPQKIDPETDPQN